MTQTAKTAADRQRVENIARRHHPDFDSAATPGQRNRMITAWKRTVMDEAGVSKDRATTAIANVIRRRK